MCLAMMLVKIVQQDARSPPPPCLGTALRKNRPLVPRSNSRTTFFHHRIGFFMVLVDAGQLFRCAGQHFMCLAWFAVFGRLYLLLYHLFHSLLCTIDVPMYTAGESVFYRRSDGSLVPATVLGPGAQSETVQIEYKSNELLVKHPAALIANLSHLIPVIPDSPDWDSAPSCGVSQEEGFHQNQLNIRSFHACWKAHYSPVSHCPGHRSQRGGYW